MVNNMYFSKTCVNPPRVIEKGEVNGYKWQILSIGRNPCMYVTFPEGHPFLKMQDMSNPPISSGHWDPTYWDGKTIGWDFAHLGDYTYGDSDPKTSKVWTVNEIKQMLLEIIDEVEALKNNPDFIESVENGEYDYSPLFNFHDTEDEYYDDYDYDEDEYEDNQNESRIIKLSESQFKNMVKNMIQETVDRFRDKWGYSDLGSVVKKAYEPWEGEVIDEMDDAIARYGWEMSPMVKHVERNGKMLNAYICNPSPTATRIGDWGMLAGQLNMIANKYGMTVEQGKYNGILTNKPEEEEPKRTRKIKRGSEPEVVSDKTGVHYFIIKPRF